MTSAELGRRLDITAAGLRALEASEAAETIKLSSLRRVADVLDCDLVVVMVPATDLKPPCRTAQSRSWPRLKNAPPSRCGLEGQVVMEPKPGARCDAMN